MAIITGQSSRTFVVFHQQPITTGRAPDRRSRSGRTLLPHASGACRAQGIPGKSRNTAVARSTHKVEADERVAIALLSPFRQLAQIAVEGGARHKTPSRTVCLGYCESLRRRGAWASSVPICLPNATLIVSTRPRIFSAPFSKVDGLVFISSKKKPIGAQFRGSPFPIHRSPPQSRH
jgi:hypothetical protein